MQDDKRIDMSLRDMLRIIFRYKFIMIACFITIMTSVYIGLELRTPVYRAEVRMLVAGKMQKDVEVERYLGPGHLILTHMSLVRSRPVIERTVEALKLYQRPFDYERNYASKIKGVLIDNSVRKLKSNMKKMTPEEKRSFLFNKAARELMGKISTILDGESSMFFIMVSDLNSAAAGRIANVLSRSYVIFDLEQQIAQLLLTYGEKNETIIKLEKHIEKLEETLDGRILPDIEAIGPATVKIISQAGQGKMLPIKPSKSGGLMVGFVMSLVLGISLAFIFDFFDQSFKSSADVEKFLDIPFLGYIPKGKRKEKSLFKHTKLVARYIQSYQNVSNRIYQSMKEKNLKSILLTDVEGSLETGIVIANLGNVLSRRAETKVFIIDADLRTGSLSAIFNLSDAAGLSDVLEGKIPFEDAINSVGSNLIVLPAGDIELKSIALLESSMMSDIIIKAKELYDIILIGCADIRHYLDAFILSSFTDSMGLVINEGSVRRHIVQSAIAPFKQKKLHLMGAAINNHKYVIPEIIYKLT